MSSHEADLIISSLCALDFGQKIGLSSTRVLFPLVFSPFVMFSRFLFSTILALSIIITAAISDLDSTWSLEDDSLFTNAELPSMNPAPFSLDQSLIPLDSNAPLFSSSQTFEDPVSLTDNGIDTSDAFPWNIDSGIISPSSGTASNNNEFNFFDENDSFQLADCSTSGSPPPAFNVRKSRLRRRGGGGETCTNSQSPPSSSSPGSFSLDQLKEFLENPAMLNLATAKKDPYQNNHCFILTDGRLPWGVCSSGQPNGQRRTINNVELAGLPLTTWSLSGASLGTLFFFFLVLFFYSKENDSVDIFFIPSVHQSNTIFFFFFYESNLILFFFQMLM